MARDAAGWLLVVALFYSPWDYGGTGATSIRVLNGILGAMFCAWLLSALLREKGRGRKEEGTWLVSPTLLGLGALLLALGWGMALNGHAIIDGDYGILLPVTSPLPGAPGSIDYALSIAWMRRATALILGLWVITDLICDQRWLLRIWSAIGLAGGSIALLGLLQKATGAEMTFWQSLDPYEPPVRTFFATYYYHGNAGAFLNLALPAVLGLAFRSVSRPGNPAVRALWITLSVIMLVGVISNTSRTGQLIAGLIGVALLTVFAGKLFRRARQLELQTAVVAILVGVAALWAITQTSHLDLSLRRWEKFQSTWESDARWLVDEVAITSLPEAGPLGFGPGAFSVVFPYFNHLDQRAKGNWLFLHNDYLQTLMEWGWVGGLLWAALFFGGMVVGIRSLTTKGQSRGWYPRQRLLLPVSLIALGGVALHAAVDFPLQIASIQLYVMTYLGICWGSANWGRRIES
jgi:O-Antigen ligase